jgi:hypothetical protein
VAARTDDQQIDLVGELGERPVRRTGYRPAFDVLDLVEPLCGRGTVAVKDLDRELDGIGSERREVLRNRLCRDDIERDQVRPEPGCEVAPCLQGGPALLRSEKSKPTPIVVGGRGSAA